MGQCCSNDSNGDQPASSTDDQVLASFTNTLTPYTLLYGILITHLTSYSHISLSYHMLYGIVVCYVMSSCIGFSVNLTSDDTQHALLKLMPLPCMSDTIPLSLSLSLSCYITYVQMTILSLYSWCKCTKEVGDGITRYTSII